MPLYMKLENPLHLKRSDSGFEYDSVLEREVPIDREGHIRDVLGLPRDASAQEVADVLRAKGYDGVTYRGHTDVGIGSQDIEVMALDQYNIKSKFNPGTFDPNDPSIMDISTAGAKTEDEAVEAARLWREMGTESPYFKRKFGNSKVVDEDGEVLPVFHGTSGDFNEFRPGSPDSAFGSAIYTSDNVDDVNVNYARAEGPDVTNKVFQEIDRISNDYIFDNLDDDQILDAAERYYDLMKPTYDVTEPGWLDQMKEASKRKISTFLGII